MVEIDGTHITMTRGDTLITKINIRKSTDGEIFIPSEGDSVLFAVKKRFKDEESLIEKLIPIDTMILELKPEDTKQLDMPRDYFYDCSITRADGRVYTFINKAILSITEEVG